MRRCSAVYDVGFDRDDRGVYEQVLAVDRE